MTLTSGKSDIVWFFSSLYYQTRLKALKRIEWKKEDDKLKEKIESELQQTKKKREMDNKHDIQQFERLFQQLSMEEYIVHEFIT